MKTRFTMRNVKSNLPVHGCFMFVLFYLLGLGLCFSEPSYITCPANAVRSANLGTCTYIAVGTEFDSFSPGTSYSLTGATSASAASSTLAGVKFNQGVTTVAWYNGSFCYFTIQVIGGNVPAVTAKADPASICNGSSSTLKAGGAKTYIWNNNLGSGIKHPVSPTATTTYKVIGTDNKGCTNSASVTVTVNLPPTVTITPSSASICKGNSVALTAAGASTYSWSGNLGTVDQVSVSPNSNKDYTVTGTDDNGCSNMATVTVTVYPKVTVKITKSPSTPIDAGTTVTLSASGADTYVWDDGSTNSTDYVTPSYTYTYEVTGTDNTPCSCTGTKTVTVNVKGKSMASLDKGTIVINQNGALLKNYPNPFSQMTTVVFSVPEDTYVKLDVYDMTGRLVKNLYAGDAVNNQDYTVEFDCNACPNGIYLYKITTGKAVYTGKMMILK